VPMNIQRQEAAQKGGESDLREKGKTFDGRELKLGIPSLEGFSISGDPLGILRHTSKKDRGRHGVSLL